MTAIKQARMIRDKTGADVYIFYIDLRTFGKGYEEFMEDTAAAGVNFIRGRVGEIIEEKGNNLTVRGEDTLLGKPIDLENVDMVVFVERRRSWHGEDGNSLELLGNEFSSLVLLDVQSKSLVN